jgi:hypothetical protein
VAYTGNVTGSVYVPLLMTAPGIGPILGYTTAAEIGDITRFPTAKKLVGYTGLCPTVEQSGGHDGRGSLAKNGPKYLRWALIEAATHAARHRVYAARYQRTKTRLGRQRGPSVARVDIARKLTEAIWHMLTTTKPLRSGRRHNHRSSRIDGPSLRCATGAKPLPSDQVLPPGGDREMSPAPHPPGRSPPRSG